MKQVNCECGYQVTGENDDELWEDAQQHFEAYHPEMVGNVDRKEFLAQAEDV